MSAKRCMNASCGTAAVAGGVWRRGWLLRSGGFATLCEKCGLAYDQLIYCDKFHQRESGWRECAFCGKHLHCGCIASKSMLDLLDGGGVQCLSCLNNYGNSSILGESIQDLLPQSTQRVLAISARTSIDEKINEYGTALVDGSSELQITPSDPLVNDDAPAKRNAMQFGGNIEYTGYSTVLLAHRENKNGSFGHVKQEQVAFHLGEFGHTRISSQDQGRLVLSQTSHRSDTKDAFKDNLSNPLAQTCLSMSFGSPNMRNSFEGCSNVDKSAVSHHGAMIDGRDQNKALTPFQDVQRVRHVSPKLPKACHGASSDTTKELVPQMRVARPPAEGRGRSQLLPRYWPRITDQELQQISGDSNSTIVPLFEKVLSASDAGRIGRLVLPKACAEAYFPPISHPEGLPLKIQDAKGKEWHFQFRFWPNNNSRMYVLEGVTPCIQALQLQAGDTVTFSRMDPEGKLVMGFRKATNTVSLQDSQISAMANGALVSETLFPAVNENLSIVNSYSGLLQPLNVSGGPQLSHFSGNLKYAEGDVSCIMTDKYGSWANEGLQQPLLLQEKRSRNIGSKSKRLLMDNEDALELKFTWEEAQDLLRPPPRVKPSIVIIEDQEFEEYEEPPVLGKRTFFTARADRERDQWIQCDDCLKWRRIPVEVLPPSKWTCADNMWDPQRTSCTMPDELTSRELQTLLQQYAEIKRRRITKQSPTEVDPAGMDALVTAVALGEVNNQVTPSVAATTKHPRHRPGCTCIVCIQPPSGKGPKHSPTCTCNVCMTVKRRFKTLMMRKKKLQSEREEAEAKKRPTWGSKEELEGEGEHRDNLEISKEHIDLNFQPHRDVEPPPAGPSSSSSLQVSMMSLLEVASLPLENYLKQNKLASLVESEQPVSNSLATVPQAPIEGDGGGSDEQCGLDDTINDAAA